jgi:hypothetical protein
MNQIEPGHGVGEGVGLVKFERVVGLGVYVHTDDFDEACAVVAHGCTTSTAEQVE